MDASQQQSGTDTDTAISRDTTRTVTGAITRATVVDLPLLTAIAEQRLTSHDIYRGTLVRHQIHDASQLRPHTCISIQKEANLDIFFCKEALVAFARNHCQAEEGSTFFGRYVVWLMSHIGYPFNRTLGSVMGNLTDFRYLSDERLSDNDLESYSDSILSLMRANPSLRVLHLNRFASGLDCLVLGLAKVIRGKGCQLKEFRLFSRDLVLSPRIFTVLWSCAAVEVLQLGYGPVFQLQDHTPHAAESLLQLRAFAREALSITSTVTHPTEADAAEFTELTRDADKIEFAWKELGHGSWLGAFRLEEILEVLQVCPNLERLVIPKLSEQDVITHLAPVVVKGLPKLRYLDLTHISDQPLGTRCLVESCKDLISLKMDRLQFASDLLVGSVVSRHDHSLETLRIHRCARMSSQELNLILSGCRRLKSLYAMVGNNLPGWSASSPSPILNTNDMAMVPEDPGWVCKDMETLELCYSSLDTSIGIPEVLWRQIGQLPKLRNLSLLRSGTREGPAVKEMKSVRQAVFSWMALPDLRRLEWQGVDAFMDETLVHEVEQQWPQLEWVRYSYD